MGESALRILSCAARSSSLKFQVRDVLTFNQRCELPVPAREQMHHREQRRGGGRELTGWRWRWHTPSPNGGTCSSRRPTPIRESLRNHGAVDRVSTCEHI